MSQVYQQNAWSKGVAGTCGQLRFANGGFGRPNGPVRLQRVGDRERVAHTASGIAQGRRVRSVPQDLA